LIPICPFEDNSGQFTAFDANESALPRDSDGDGFVEDLNGNGRIEFLDLLIYFEQMDWISENEPVELFDYNQNGRIDFSDCIKLFDKI
jgi:PKD repeat protein